jgi:excisionase family DNA binding protein
MQDEQLTIEEIAELVQVGQDTVRAWLARGLAHTQEDGVVLVQKSDLNTFMEREGQGQAHDAAA